jgi:CRISPR-associated endonuclease Csn1
MNGFTYIEPKVSFKTVKSDTELSQICNAYLKSYFGRVESVKGGMVAEFRKALGIRKAILKTRKYYEVKDRNKATITLFDAATIACMTKD